MQHTLKRITTLVVMLSLTSITAASSFILKSNDISHGEFMNKKHEFQGFGCSGDNLSPHLSWQGAPEGTAAFAITVYDPDAPTGSGWWHWQVVNIPKTISTLPTGAGDLSKNLSPKGSLHISNDYGVAGFGGACPPEGNGAHRYQFTVHALSKILELPEDASGALAGFMINSNSLGSSTIEALYKR